MIDSRDNRSGVCRTFAWPALVLAVIGCAGGGTRTDDGSELTQRQQAAALNAQLGSDYFRQGNLEEAKRKLERALEQDSRNITANMVIGLLYDRIGEQGKAESHLQRAVSLDDKNPETRNALAVFLCRHGKFEAGEKHALMAAAEPLYKTRELALLNAGYCARGAGDGAKAEKYFRQALQVQPRFAPALYEMADLSYRAGEYLTARAFLERHLASTPPTPASLLLGYRIETANGKRAVAGDYARKLRNEYSTSDEAKVLADLERTGR